MNKFNIGDKVQTLCVFDMYVDLDDAKNFDKVNLPIGSILTILNTDSPGVDYKYWMYQVRTDVRKEPFWLRENQIEAVPRYGHKFVAGNKVRIERDIRAIVYREDGFLSIKVVYPKQYTTGVIAFDSWSYRGMLEEPYSGYRIITDEYPTGIFVETRDLTVID